MDRIETSRSVPRLAIISRCFLMSVLVSVATLGQEPALSPSVDSPGIAKFTTQEDHQHMLQLLGITKLRPGKSGNASATNAANTDEALATPFESLPELLKLRGGLAVTTADAWWNQRRPELLEDFEREVIGRVPSHVPKVQWEVIAIEEKKLGAVDVVQKQLEGKVDRSWCPEIEVTISMVVVTPKSATAPVPVLMMFGFTGFEPWAEEFRKRFNRGGLTPPPGAEPPASQQLVERGWGVATISPGTIQADNGEGLTRGIVGLTNRGQPRRAEDWGALRAWAWGASRGLDYLETDSDVDAKRVGIEGVSRYGKAALVTLAMDTRFATGLIGSAGEGGTSLYRRNFGESVENVASSGEYHWMAGNFLKYAAAESSFGSMTAMDLPVDAHTLLALCAPRPTFVSYGIPEKGDALWLDQQGSFMAAIAAQPVFRLLGARGLGRSDTFLVEKMPAVNVDLLEGELAWRQHDGGHTDLPNIKHFVAWANRMLDIQPSIPVANTARPRSTHRANPRADANSILAHEQLIEKTRRGAIDVYFIGDSITRRWGATDYPDLLSHWRRHFHGWNAANFGWGGDSTHHILWRLQNGELQGVQPKLFMVQAGANNLPWTGPASDAQIDDVVLGIEAILDCVQQHAPESHIVLTAMFPRRQNPELEPAIDRINQALQATASERRVTFVNINAKLVDQHGILLKTMSDDGLHLNEPAYEIWAAALKPTLYQRLGPPAEVDTAPPATGNPDAAK